MTHLTQFEKMLKSANHKDWGKIEYEKTIKNGKEILIDIEKEELSFVFDLQGKFLGISNYKW